MIVTSAGYQGDIRLGETVDCKFSTSRFSTGASHTLGGTPAISAYVGNGTTEITAGITLTVDFDGRTGLHNVRVVASGGNGFAAATNVTLVITAGSVDGVDVVGQVVGSFSIENRPPPNALTFKSLTVAPDAGGGTAVTFTGGAASGATPAGHGFDITGGAASTTGGGTAGQAIKATGGAGAASNNGAAIGVSFAAGGTVTVSGNTGFSVSGSGVAYGLLCSSGSGGLYGAGFVGPSTGAGGGVAMAGGSGSADGDGLFIQGVNNAPALLFGSNQTANTIEIGSGGGHCINIVPSVASGNKHGINIRGMDASGATPAGHGINLQGGTASTTGGGTAGQGLRVTGGSGAASTNGAGEGAAFFGGTITTVIGATAFSCTGSSGLHGMRLTSGDGGIALNLVPNGGGSKAIADNVIVRATFAADTGLLTLLSGTASAGGANTITISTHATAQYWRFRAIKLTGGTGVGQDAWIIDYNNATGVATVLASGTNGNWLVNPDGTTTFAILDTLPYFAAGQIVF